MSGGDLYFMGSWSKGTNVSKLKNGDYQPYIECQSTPQVFFSVINVIANHAVVESLADYIVVIFLVFFLVTLHVVVVVIIWNVFKV